MSFLAPHLFLSSISHPLLKNYPHPVGTGQGQAPPSPESLSGIVFLCAPFGGGRRGKVRTPPGAAPLDPAQKNLYLKAPEFPCPRAHPYN